MTKLLLPLLMLFGAVSTSANPLATPPLAGGKLDSVILALDSQFWTAYNSCNLEGMASFLATDVEFYHDKGGLTTSSATLVQQIKEGLCADQGSSLRREAVAGTVKVYPLNNFGAIITGDHLFYFKEKGEAESLIERAKFTHIWRYQDENWKMTRVLSYDHQPHSENSDKTSLTLSKEALQKFAGQYNAPNTGSISMTLEEGNLNMQTTNMGFKLYPESETLFFVKEAPLTFEFIQDQAQKVLKFIVRENGKIVEEALRVE